MNAFLSGLVLILLLASPQISTAAGGRSKVRLLQKAGLENDRVRLSDFLPSNVSQTTRDAASAIVLGRTPQLGSLRVFADTEILSRIGNDSPLLDQLSVPGQFSVTRSGWPIPRESLYNVVVELLTKQGWVSEEMPEASTLRWPEEFAAAVPEPKLEADNLIWDNRRRNFSIEVSCVERQTCATFLVQFPPTRPVGVCWSHEDSSLSPELSREAAAECSPGHKPWVKAGNRQAPEGRKNGHPRFHARSPILARAGQTAILQTNIGSVRISMPVICLQRGSQGQIIRVRDPSTHRIFRAQISGAGLLQASF